MGYARTNVIVSKTSFVRASVSSSMLKNVYLAFRRLTSTIVDVPHR